VRLAGAAIRGDELVLVTVIRSEADLTIEGSASIKLKLNGGANQESVRAFFSAVAGFVRNNNIDRVVVKGRQAKGQFAGGPTSFKIEGLLQVLENCKIDILMPATIAAAVKRHNFSLPTDAFKYQKDAFETACCALMA
jgi:Protein of unknown function (DUF3010)